MKFRQIISLQILFFLTLYTLKGQDTPVIQHKISLSNGSEIHGKLLSMDEQTIIILKQQDTILLDANQVLNMERKEIPTKTTIPAVPQKEMPPKNLKPYNFMINGIGHSKNALRSNMLVDNSVDFNKTNWTLSLNTIIFESGLEYGLTFMQRYGQSKFFHPYAYGSFRSRNFINNSYIGIGHGLTIGNPKNHLNVEVGIPYSVRTNNTLGLNYKFGFHFQVSSNGYLFGEHVKSAAQLINSYNSFGLSFMMKRMMGQIGVQHIYTRNEFLIFSNFNGSVILPMIRIVKAF
jgi:hypothetical protein